MDEKNLKLLSTLIPSNYVNQAIQARKQRENKIKILLTQKSVPKDGWDDQTIEILLSELSTMDSNNFLENTGVGEREGRIYSSLVARRNYFMAHGVGRSGDIVEVQPKAAGSSIMYKLANIMALDILKLSGIKRLNSALLLPTATGMSLTLCLLAMKQEKPSSKYVLWPRIDQKSCFKCIFTAGLIPIIIPNILQNDELRTNIKLIEQKIEELKAENILCLLSTTSCFAPRAYDSVIEIGEICKKNNLMHLINNAYGLQDTKCTHNINEAIRIGRVDLIVQSTDKNFMVPVGGAIVASPSSDWTDKVSKIYPGRASSSPIMDFFITVLSMGQTNYLRLVKSRKEMFTYFTSQLENILTPYGERILSTPNNGISISISLQTLKDSDPTLLGSMLFSRNCSGVRVIPKITKEIQGYTFKGFGSHYDDYPMPYMTVAASIGMTQKDIDTFISRLKKVLSKQLKKEQSVANEHLTSEEQSVAKEHSVAEKQL